MSSHLARVFSGIQPTGVPHLGNYFGAIAQWIRLTNEPRHLDIPPLVTEDQNKVNSTKASERIHCDVPIFSIVDMHAYTSQSVNYGKQLYENILSTAASLLALGIDPKKCILFRQSDLLEHSYLNNVLDNFVSANRLKRMIQYKEKAKVFKSSDHIINGLLNYPVLQAADILLYKASLVPVGEDQIQHVELTRDIAIKFNKITNSQVFPEPRVLLEGPDYARRIKSLRDPAKKMSKSDVDKKSFIEIIDEPDIIIEKVKKAITDCESAIFFDPVNRPGISNLMRIHSLTTGESFEKIAEQFKGTVTSQYKSKLADILIEKFKPVRKEYNRLKGDREHLEQVLKLGRDKAIPIAQETVAQVKHLLGSYRLND